MSTEIKYFIIFSGKILFKIMSKHFFSESVSTDGNTTTSVLNLMPTVNDDNALLICRAQNLRLSHQYIEDGWELQVYCKLEERKRESQHTINVTNH